MRACLCVCDRGRDRDRDKDKGGQQSMWRIFFNHSHPNFLRQSLQMDSEINNLFWLPGLLAHTSFSTVLGVQACSFGFQFYAGVGEVLKLGRKHF